MNKTGNRMRRQKPRASGFSLVETVIAIAVIGVTFIGIIGLLGLGVANDQTSSDQTIATNIAASIISDLRSTPSSSPTGKSTRYSLTLPTSVNTLSSVTPTVIYFDNSQNLVGSPTGAAYKATIYLAQVGSVGPSPAQVTDIARVAISWPAQATTPATGNVDVITMFRIN